MAEADFSSEALLLAELAYPDIREFEKKVHGDANTAPIGNAAETAQKESQGKHRIRRIQETVPGTWDYGTARWALRNMGWLGASKVMGTYMGGSLKSTQSTIITQLHSSRLEREHSQNGKENENNAVTGGNEPVPTAEMANNRAAAQGEEPFDPLARVPDWQPRCPHCGKPNEYGYNMCDPVLPRICQGGFRYVDTRQGHRSCFTEVRLT